MKVRSFRDLRVWQMGTELVEAAYDVTGRFPAHERCGLAGQIQRAAVSVPSNIAEGHARHHLGEYLQHLSIAQASLAEVDTQLEIAARLRYVTEEKESELRTQLESLGKQLSALRSALSR